MWWLCFAQKDINKVMRVYVHTYIRTYIKACYECVHTYIPACRLFMQWPIPYLCYTYVHDIHTLYSV